MADYEQLKSRLDAHEIILLDGAVPLSTYSFDAKLL